MESHGHTISDIIPDLLSSEKSSLNSLCNSYYNNLRNYTIFDNNVIIDNLVSNSCFTDGKLKINCSVFVQLIWMGIDISTFSDPDNYDGSIVKKFDWGYKFKFLSRKYAYGITNTDGLYYGYNQPNSNNYEGSYSYNSYYTKNSTNRYNQKFYSFAYAADMARELYELGCEIPLSEINVGDLIFFRSRDMDDGSSDLLEKMSFRHIDHVALVTSINSDGTIRYLIESTDSSTTPIIYTSFSSSHAADKTRMASLLTRVVMCARHPHAYGIESDVGNQFIKIID